MKFAQKRLTCLGCKAPLPGGATTVCKHCKDKVGPYSGGCGSGKGAWAPFAQASNEAGQGGQGTRPSEVEWG